MLMVVVEAIDLNGLPTNKSKFIVSMEKIARSLRRG